MTDLTQALVELRRVTPPSSPWEAGDFGVGSTPVDYHIATILNAVLSGDLIPRADADLALALMVKEAATHVRTAEVPREETGEGAMQRALLNYAADVVSLCAPASALAELQALRDERDRLDAVTNTLSEMWEGEQTARHSAEAELVMLRAQVERLVGAAEALGAMPEGYCFCSRNRIGDDSKTHEPECADLRAALTEGAAP